MVSEVRRYWLCNYGLGGLILIVVEYGLGVMKTIKITVNSYRLNPYCSGIWSRRTSPYMMPKKLYLA